MIGVVGCSVISLIPAYLQATKVLDALPGGGYACIGYPSPPQPGPFEANW